MRALAAEVRPWSTAASEAEATALPFHGSTAPSHAESAAPGPVNTAATARRARLSLDESEQARHGRIGFGGGGARHVSGELILLFRCHREARERGEEHARFERNAHLLMEELPDLVAQINNKSLKWRDRAQAVSRIAVALSAGNVFRAMVITAPAFSFS